MESQDRQEYQSLEISTNRVAVGKLAEHRADKPAPKSLTLATITFCG